MTARRSVHTVLAEMNPAWAGQEHAAASTPTGTGGGWARGEVMAMVDAMHDRLRHERQSGVLPTWNIEAKLEALLRQRGEWRGLGAQR